MDTRTALLGMPTDIQEMVWRKYHKGCITDMIEHRQHMLHSRLVKELYCRSRMCTLDDEENPWVFSQWFFDDIHEMPTSTTATFNKWINHQSPPFDEWYCDTSADYDE